MKRSTLRAALIGTTALTALMAITPARAAEIDSGPASAIFYGISPDGGWIAGTSQGNTSFVAPTFWQASDLTFPTWLGATGAAMAASDGGGIVGWYQPSSTNVAFYIAPGTHQAIILPGSNAQAFAINANSTVAVGTANGLAARWDLSHTAQAPTVLNVTQESSGAAYGVDDSGTVIVGHVFQPDSNLIPHENAIVWVNGLGHSLSDHATTADAASALAVSGDGTVAVGYDGLTGSPIATRWTWTLPSGGGTNASPISLGTLNPGEISQATAVNHDGSIVVGWSGTSAPDATNPNTLAGASAFRWTPTDNTQSVLSVLTGLGVNMGGWHLTAATGVSADGTIIVGYGTSGNSAATGWLARLTISNTGGGTTGGGTTGGGGTTTTPPPPPPPPSGFLSLDVLAESFAGQSAIGQMGNSIIGGDLAAFNQYALQDHSANGNTPWSVFGYASYNSDPAGSGTVGITRDLTDSMIIGAAVSADYATTSMVFSGNATMQGGSGGAFVARVPDGGLQWFLGIDGTSLSGSVARGYLDGSSPVSSKGNTGIDGYGAMARIGWAFNNVIAHTRVTPFVSYTYTSAHVDGYTESGGPFPAQMDGFDSDQQTARVGADVRYTFFPSAWLWGSAAWAHVVNGSNGPTISGELIGLFGVSAPGITGASDWAEVTAGIRLPAWSNGAVTASVTASVPTDSEPVTYVARLGLSQTF